MIANPTLSHWSRNASRVSVIRIPGIASSLSTVPPVCPSPLPDILVTLAPSAAAIGPTIKEVLSPTPPVECLSEDSSPKRLRSSMSPERAML